MSILACITVLLLIYPSFGLLNCTPTALSDDYYNCKGQAGVMVEIGCGNIQENGMVNFTYFVQQNQMLLSKNSPFHLTYNITSADNGRTICCQPSNKVGTFCYNLNISYPPEDNGYRQQPGSFKMPYNVICPVQSNPSPTCSWRIISPCKPSGSNLSREVTYTNNGCTLRIPLLTVDWGSDVCYLCTATNELGSNTFPVNSIRFRMCQAEGAQTITSLTNDQVVESTGSVLQRFIGDSLTLICTGTAIFMAPANVYWKANLTEINDHRCYSCSSEGTSNMSVTCTQQYSEEECTSVSTLNFTYLTLNDTGNYTCVIDDGGTFAYNPTSVLLSVTERTSLQDSTLEIALPIGIALVLVMGVSVVLLVLWVTYYQKAKAEAKRYEIEELEAMNNGELRYDVFLSFADIDRTVTEEKIKNPLENLGYVICWHHRDFIAGYDINDNMVACTRASRMTIVMLSQAFVQSEFCKEEFRLANLKGRQTKKRCIVPILVEKCKLPDEMGKLTYISIEGKDFMKKLCRDLGKPKIKEQKNISHAI